MLVKHTTIDLEKAYDKYPELKNYAGHFSHMFSPQEFICENESRTLIWVTLVDQRNKSGYFVLDRGKIITSSVSSDSTQGYLLHYSIHNLFFQVQIISETVYKCDMIGIHSYGRKRGRETTIPSFVGISFLKARLLKLIS